MVRPSTTQSKDGTANGHPLGHALSYLRAGLSGIPIRRDGSKAPDVDEWSPYQERRASEGEARRWWDKARPPGIAILGGRVSGGLEIIDFDVDAGLLFPAWSELVERERPGLVARLPIVRTPRQPEGYHAYYRCVEVQIPGNTKLASDPERPAKERTLIETRGAGGYVVAPGSPCECHSTGQTWEHVDGPPLIDVPTITAAEREVLLRCARAFDKDVPAEEPKGERQARQGTGTSPGDDFNRRGPKWAALLEPHGWEDVRTVKGVTYWRRPEKDAGWSATTDYCSNDKSGELFAVFSSNAAPFDGPIGGRSCSCYSRFATYTLLNHGGDFKVAAKELARQGYGDQAAPARVFRQRGGRLVVAVRGAL
jgi:hypothetical protein